MKRLVYIMAACVAISSCAKTYDVVVVGGGTGGTAAAIEAARNGSKVLVVEESPWLGGMLTSAGVSAVDGSFRLRGGIFAEFTDSLAARYGSVDTLFSGWVSKIMFNPRVGAEIFGNIAAEAGVEVKFNTTVTSFEKGWKLKLSDGSRVKARILIDGTELGDLAREAGIPALEDSRALQDMTYAATVKFYDHPVPVDKPEGYDPEYYRTSATPGART